MASEAQEDKKFTREQFERLYNTLTDDQKRQIEELEEQTEDLVEYFCDGISEICQALIFTVLSFLREDRAEDETYERRPADM